MTTPPTASDPPPATALTDPDRRAFLRLVSGLWGGLALGLSIPALRYFTAPLVMEHAVSVTPVARLPVSAVPVDGAWAPVQLEFQLHQGWLRGVPTAVPAFARTTDGTIELCSAICTHQGCQVAWQAAENAFVCPCHQGRFDVEGAVLNGPPTEPLPRLDYALDGADLVIALPGADEAAA